MSSGLTSAGWAAAILIGMAATAAHAEPKAPPGASFTAREAFAPDLNQWGPQRTSRSLQWDAKKGKWGLKLDVERNQLRDLGWSETGAGAYYKVTPGLRVGGGVSVQGQNSELNALAPRDRAPKVKLETAFKF